MLPRTSCTPGCDDLVGELLERRARDRLVPEVLRVGVGHEQADRRHRRARGRRRRLRLAGDALPLTEVVSFVLGPSFDNAASAVVSFWTDAGIIGRRRVRTEHDAAVDRDGEARRSRGPARRGRSSARRAAGPRQERRSAPAPARADNTGVAAVRTPVAATASGARSACTAIAVDRDEHDRERDDEHPPTGQAEGQSDRRCR